MFDFETFGSTPFGSMLIRTEREQVFLTETFMSAPGKIRRMLTSSQSGAYIRGVVKGMSLPVEKSQLAAFAILRVALGRKTLAQLPSLLSTELKLPNDKAQKMAREIEEDLFGPVRKELEEYWRGQKSGPPVGRGSPAGGPPAPEASAFAPAGASVDKSADKTGGKSARQGQESETGVRNVLNLKEQKRPPAPPPMPRLSNQ